MNFGWADGSFGMLDFEGLEGEALEAAQSGAILAKIGSFIAPIFAPLGFGTWKFAVAAVSGLIAKENVVATMGMLYGYAEVAEDGAEYWTRLAADITQAGAFSYLIFNLLCAPCFAAIGAIKREMNNARWTWFAIGYQMILAYLASFVVYQLWQRPNAIGMVIAVIILIGWLYLLFRPNKYDENAAVSAGVKA